MIVVVASGWVSATTWGRRPGAEAVARSAVIEPLRRVWLAHLEGWLWRRRADILHASDSLSLELTIVKFVHRILEIRGGLILHEASAIAVTAYFGVDDIEA